MSKRRAPSSVPFVLTRCKLCKKSKQGAIFCRVLRAHAEDGWEAPDGFAAWLAAWEAEPEPEPEAPPAPAAEGPAAAPLERVAPRARAAARREAERREAEELARAAAEPPGEEAPKRARSPGKPPARSPKRPRSAPRPAQRRTVSWGASEDSLEDWAPQPPRPPATPPPLVRRQPGVAWVRGALSDEAVDAYVASAAALGVGEELALEQLHDRSNDAAAALAALADAPEARHFFATRVADAARPRRADPALASGVDAFLAAAAFLVGSARELGGGGPPAPPRPLPPPRGRLARPDRGGFSPEDAAKFGEALLDCDRDCGAALRRLRKTPRGGLRGEVNAFARASVGDVLDLYYGDFKPSGGYGAWKARLKGRRDEAARHEELLGVGGAGNRWRLGGSAAAAAAAADQKAPSAAGLVDLDDPRVFATIPGDADRRASLESSLAATRRAAERAEAERRARAAAPPAPATPPPPGAAPAARLADATEEAKRVIGLSRYDPRAPLVFDCPCGCGERVDNRGRAASHRRKWATRSCRERAARSADLGDAFLALPPNSAEGARRAFDALARSPEPLRRDSSSDAEPAPDLSVCLCGCGQTIDNAGRSGGHRRKWASAACRQRAHSERAREARRTGAAPPSPAAPAPAPATSAPPPPALSPPASPPAAPAARRFLVHAGVLVAKHFDGVGTLSGAVVGRAPPRRDEDTGAVVRAWTVSFDAPGGATRAVDLDARAVADLALRGPGGAPAPDDAGDGDHRRFRGVTCKWYADTPRYNAAFSLLGDRFSLGGFDTAAQAARCWDLVAFRAGRDDLNLLAFASPKPNPSHDDQRVLAARLRDNMRARNAPVDADAVVIDRAAPPPAA